MMKRLMAMALTLMMLCLAAVPALATGVSDDLRQMMESNIFRPADVGFPAEASYDFPYMGLQMALPQTLLDMIAQHQVYMSLEEGNRSADGELQYARVYWSAMTEEQRNTELSMVEDDMGEWLQSLQLLGGVAFCHKDVLDQLAELSGSTWYEKLGESEDGKYHYYLFYGEDAQEQTVQLMRDITLTYTDIEPYPDFCGTGILGEELAEEPKPEAVELANVGTFATQDINGNPVDESVFAQNKLTLVNVMATWCSPCVAEMPELAKLPAEMAEQGVGVVAFVMDTMGRGGETDSRALEKAKQLADRAGASFPMLVPEQTLLNGWLADTSVVPTTFFVDSEGNLVGDFVMGARRLAEWKAIAEERLTMLTENAQ